MAVIVRYLTHPQVTIDPAVPVPLWSLNEVGRARAETFAGYPCLRNTTRIVASGEVKAVETADVIARMSGLAIEVREAMHENDRSATGFLPSETFEAVADRIFAAPEESVRGWECAIDAQLRIVRSISRNQTPRRFRAGALNGTNPGQTRNRPSPHRRGGCSSLPHWPAWRRSRCRC
ncbi:MAG: histidine phosphatase family protein [Pseudomonadota bacterium]